MSAAVKFAIPPSWLFEAPRGVEPATPPTDSAPFQIPPSIYNSLLDMRVPVTIATVYAVTVHILNHYASTSKPPKPYAIAKTRAFYWFVVLHNLFLAVYSAWTFVGITAAITRAIPSVYNEEGWSRTMHSLCKIQPEEEIKGQGLWQEGLAFYGWLFYISKFYEVIDTAIILAKGRKSSTLQTYHHAGAMMCMWAGIRFMAPPIVVFVLFNSAIHALMYTYYTLSTLKIRVPGVVKRSLTTMQISQFIIGGSLAAVQLFIEYLPPMSVTGRKVVDEVAAASQMLGEKKREFVHCLDHSGETFAIIANVLYLTPLTYLFVMFFLNSYTNRGKAPTKSEKDAVKPKAAINGKTVAA